MKTKAQLALIIILSLLGCHILNKDNQTLKKLSQKEDFQLTEQRKTNSQQSQFVLTDSNHNDFTLMLWPKGKFNLSLTKGFEGEAEKVLIRGKHTNLKTVKLTEEIKQDSTLLMANYNNEKESITAVKKNKLSIGYNWAWILVIPVFYILYRLLRISKSI